MREVIDASVGISILTHFSKERPLVVPPALYERLSQIPEFADHMERVMTNTFLEASQESE